MSLFEIFKSKPEKPKEVSKMNRDELLAELAKHHFDRTLPDITGDLARDINASFIKKIDKSRSDFPESYNIYDMNDEELRAAVEILRMSVDLDTAVEAEK